VSVAVLPLALAIDLLLGEPPTPLHPVVWMGRAIGWIDARRPSRPEAELVYGTAAVVTGAGLSYATARLALALSRRAGKLAYVLAAAWLFKSTFSLAQLARRAIQVERDLLRQDVVAARASLQHLVSRDTATLSDRQVAAATIESVAENSVDSFVGPLFWYLLLGVPGAVAYRFVNTADAMIGYHGHYEYLGKAAARLDDALNWLPARLTALLLAAAAALTGRPARAAWQTALRDHRRTESPNAGWPMAAAAGALDVPLEKVGHYRLGSGPEANLRPRSIRQAVELMTVTAALAASLTAGVQWGKHVRGRR